MHGYSNDIFQAGLDAKAAKPVPGPAGHAEGRRRAGRRQHGDPQRDAPRPDLALQFINFMLEGKNSAELTNLIGSATPTWRRAQYIKPELKALPAIFPPKDVQAKLTQPHRP